MGQVRIDRKMRLTKQQKVIIGMIDDSKKLGSLYMFITFVALASLAAERYHLLNWKAMESIKRLKNIKTKSTFWDVDFSLLIN